MKRDNMTTVELNNEAVGLKDRAREMKLMPMSGYARLRDLIVEGFFDFPVSSSEIVTRITERFGERWATGYVQTYMKRFLEAAIIHAVKVEPHVNYWVLSSVGRHEALRQISKSRRIVEIEGSLFSSDLTERLERDFSKELQQLNDVFGIHGDCTAFLLRKILEKLLLIVFRKARMGDLIQDRSRPGAVVGLDALIEVAMREKISDHPVLSGKTGNHIKGIKFLGDVAAHNPLINVDTSEILPQMPFLIAAYKELAVRL